MDKNTNKRTNKIKCASQNKTNKTIENVVTINNLRNANAFNREEKNIALSSVAKYILNSGIDGFIENVLHTRFIDLSIDQKESIKKMLDFLYNDKSLFCLFGYAGTGKTTTVIELINVLFDTDLVSSVALAAPTNKATDIIKAKIKKYIDQIFEKKYSCANDCTNKQEGNEFTNDDKLLWLKDRGIKIDIITIHKLLNYNNDFNIDGEKIFVKKGKSFIDKYDIVVIDECSMLPVDIVNDIFDEVRKTKNNCVNAMQSTSDKINDLPDNSINSNAKDYKNIKVIFVGDYAQLPPVNEKVSLIFANNIKILYETLLPQLKITEQPILVVTDKTLTNKIEVMYEDITKMDKYTLTQIVRSNNSNIINLSNEIRQWVLGYKNPELKKFRGNGVQMYNNRSKQLWFDKFIKYYNDNTNNIILAWRNVTCDRYNNEFRRSIFGSENLCKYIKGDILLINDFYNYDEIKLANKTTKFYTSEQVKVNDVEEVDYIPNLFSNIKYKSFKDSSIVSKTCETIDKINKSTVRKYKIYKLYVSKLGDGVFNDSAYINIMHEDSVNKHEYDKNLICEEIKKLRLFFARKYKNKLKTLEKYIIKQLWKDRERNYISPFCNVNYGASISCHKSQASTYHNVFVDLKDILLNKNYEECKRCIYTALTRASNELHILV